MTIDPTTLAAVVAELQPLVGARIQRVDIVAERELVLEVRCPGRTIRLLVSARPGAGRLHLVDERPEREVPGGDLQRALRRRLEGRPLVALMCDRRTVELDARDAVVSVRLDGGRDAITFLPPSGRTPPESSTPVPEHFPLSEEIARRFGVKAPASAAERLRGELSKRIRTRRQKLDKLRTNLTRDRDKLTKMLGHRQEGELLKTMLGRIPRGATEVKATDWSTGLEVVIHLDPALGPKQNLERIFSRAKKAERGLPIVEKRLAEVAASIASLDEELERVKVADREALLELGEAGGLAGGRMRIEGLEPLAEKPSDPSKRSPLDRWSRRFVAADGTEIRVGKGAKENDRLTFSAAKGDDLWLHASGTSGAHVLVRLSKGATVGPGALLDAAHLAAHYSGSGGAAGRVEVLYTEARWVKKHKGDPPGRVSVSKARTMLVTIDPKRLDRLFGR